MQPQNPFEGKQLRCLYDKAAQKWWFSAVDICAIITGKDYDEARTNWYRLNFERNENQLIRKSNQLKMPGKDGKYYSTEVLDIREVVYLIQIIPDKNAEPFRLWLADLIVQNTDIELLLAQAGEKDAADIEEHRQSRDKPYVMHEIVRTKFDLEANES